MTHYSYAHYADRDVAEGFDALRFSGPIGRYLLEQQETILRDALAPLGGRIILDVGTGTGRAALSLAAQGARVIGLDYSAEMLGVAAGRAREQAVRVNFGRADAQALPIASKSVDAAVCLRLLMHVVDWRRAVGELCRVARSRVVVDFPAAASVAALESAARRLKAAMGGTTEAYRVMSLADVRAAFSEHGFRIVDVRRQFVLPIAMHKKVGRLGVTRGIEGALASVGLLRAFGSPVTVVAER